MYNRFETAPLVPVPEITPDQQATADVLAYLKVEKLFTKSAIQYAEWKTGIRKQDAFGNEAFQTSFEQARVALEDRYVAGNDDDFNRQWQEEAEPFLRLYEKIEPQVKTIEANYQKKAPRFTSSTLARSRYQIMSKFASLNAEQKLHVLELTGYSPQEAKKIIWRTLIGTSLGLGLAAFAYPYVFGAAVEHEFEPQLKALDQNMGEIPTFISTYVAHYASLYVLAQQHIRMMNNEHFKFSPSSQATIAHYLFKGESKEEQRAQRNWVRLATASQSIAQDITLGAAYILPFLQTEAPSFIESANLAGTVFNLSLALLEAITLEISKVLDKKSNYFQA